MESTHLGFAEFQAFEIRIATVLDAWLNEKAHTPAYVLQLDFGPQIGLKTSSAQLTENYTSEALIGQQVCAVMNFPPRRVAGVKSEVLVLAAVCESNGTVLLFPAKGVENGTRIA